MDKDKLFRMAEDPRFIPGIYNYCDRWCERCSFTSRCLNYAMEQENPEELATKEMNKEAFWQKLNSIFEQTREMLRELAKEQGIDLKSSDIEEAARERKLQKAEADSHELAQGAREYAEKVNKWFESEASLIEQKMKYLNTRLKLGIDGDAPCGEAVSIGDSVEVIRWYQHQIYVKLMRALRQDKWNDDIEDDPIQTDSNGSAKVALIGMQRSISAWIKLRNHLPEKEGSTLTTLLHLDRLRRITERCFPNALKFVRPGFDTGDSPQVQ